MLLKEYIYKNCPGSVRTRTFFGVKTVLNDFCEISFLLRVTPLKFSPDVGENLPTDSFPESSIEVVL